MKLLVFPESTNPIQELLYQQMSRIHAVQYQYVSFRKTRNLVLNCLLFPFVLLVRRIQGYVLIHIHWWYEFGDIEHSTIFFRFFYSLYVCFVIVYIRIIGYRFVYTAHDNIMKESQFLCPKLLTKVIIYFAHYIILLSGQTRKDLQSSGIKIPSDKCSVIFHGNYEPWYENTITRKRARAMLGVPQTATVLLYLGIIRKYKGVEKFLQVIQPMLRQYPRLYVIIAGNCYRDTMKKQILQLASNVPQQIKTILTHIPDRDIQKYFNASDCAVFPFTTVTNSGSVVLAATFKKPFIAPEIGSIRDFPKQCKLTYDPKLESGLSNAIHSAVKNKKKLSFFGELAYQYVTNTTWDDIARLTMNVYQYVLDT